MSHNFHDVYSFSRRTKLRNRPGFVIDILSSDVSERTKNLPSENLLINNFVVVVVSLPPPFFRHASAVSELWQQGVYLMHFAKTPCCD
jgi:hypothetical protein